MTPADVIEFVGRGARAQYAVDAFAIGARVCELRKQIDEARAARTIGYRVAMDLERELAELARALATHFERFAR